MIETIRNVAATGFEIQKYGSWQKLTVVDPWQKSVNTRFDYFLVENGKKVPDDIKDQHIFFTPLKNVICLSTTHIGFLDALGEVTSISGLSGSKYLTNKEVNRGVAEYRIREVGYEGGLNYEMILQLKPDVVFAYGVGSEINAQVNKLQDLGIPVVLVGEYLEQSPLAKAEWIRFFGAFFGKEKLAMDVFAQISTNYNTIKATVADETDKPAVLTGLPFKDTWWMAGGQSNLAMLINDAGGKFLWNENQSKEAFPVSLEEVFLRAAQADFWIN
ncbi:MAG TPA: ABC transporter substrate-binding protein, partial [Prolixibacteraceae bacterium]|nr:ABC transporter substrate-binding protein [Prolixibacteraceae bacterium]